MGVNESWRQITLGQVITLQRGFDLPHRQRREGKIPIVSSSGVSDFHFQSMVAAPGVITGRYGTIGEVFYLNEDYWPLNTTLYVRDFKNNVPKFVFYLLKTIDFASHSGKSGVPGVNRNDLHTLDVILPPLPEQQAIASALSDTDDLIAALEALIAKKQAIKQGAMQELLTGHKRLPGFEGEWVSQRLIDVTTLNPGINKPISFLGSGTLYVTVQELYIGNNIDIESLGRIRLTGDEIDRYHLKAGDIIFGKSSVKRDGIGYPNIFTGANEPVVCTGFAFRARPKANVANPAFLFYILRMEETRRWLIDNSQASALTNINKSIANNIPVLLPPVAEQQAIASILSDMDSEIAQLEDQLSKTRALKQGMMQELLTGRIRLV